MRVGFEYVMRFRPRSAAVVAAILGVFPLGCQRRIPQGHPPIVNITLSSGDSVSVAYWGLGATYWAYQYRNGGSSPEGGFSETYAKWAFNWRTPTDTLVLADTAGYRVQMMLSDIEIWEADTVRHIARIQTRKGDFVIDHPMHPDFPMPDNVAAAEKWGWPLDFYVSGLKLSNWYEGRPVTLSMPPPVGWRGDSARVTITRLRVLSPSEGRAVVFSD